MCYIPFFEVRCEQCSFVYARDKNAMKRCGQKQPCKKAEQLSIGETTRGYCRVCLGFPDGR
ncbi:hypothetical protein CSHISOI_11807 [Colletotrichum shisoi]|uniref:Uncharacterized protein n=1 Tax=Colletotrichum shisoi TaxID=2078593 RepID=A0A5Q4BA28_9PEZI|nr:hypothetical protein CSHISOI_11807 [Colletotrichum shisoi]